MDRTKHIYRKNETVYEMVIEKQKNSQVYVVIAENVMIQPKHQESAVTPTTLFFYELQENNKIDITKTIEKTLKNEIIEDYWKTASKEIS